MLSYTVDSLIESARRRGHLTHSAGTMDTADLVAIMDDELQTYMMSFVMSLREEYAVADYDLTVVSGTAEYALPPRAIGGKLRLVLVLDGATYRPLTRVEPSRVVSPVSSSGTPQGYYFKGNRIGFTPCGAASVRLEYFRRPGRLVLEEDAGQVTALDSGTGIVTFDTLPLEWVDGDDIFDFVASQPLFDSLGMDLTGTINATAATVTFDPADLPATLAVGDWIALAGESPIPQIPAELHPLLAQRTNVKALEAIDAGQAAAFATRALEEEKRLSHMLVDDRDEGSARFIINRNGPGWRYGGRIRY